MSPRSEYGTETGPIRGTRVARHVQSHGAKQVDNAQKSAASFGEALRKAGNRDATIVLFPQANHRIMLGDGGEFAPGYLDLRTGWAATHTLWTKRQDPSST